MKFLFITDIFGRTEAFSKLVTAVIPRGDDVVLIDPYHGQVMAFAHEAEAYEYFTHTVGLENYTRLVQETLRCLQETTRCVGFSVGASVLWHALAKEETFVDKAVCFYGSQIRNALHVNPKCETFCCFPEKEPHFSVDEVIQALSFKKHVTCRKTAYAHGFMNPHSKNFDKEAYETYCIWLRETLLHGKS